MPRAVAWAAPWHGLRVAWHAANLRRNASHYAGAPRVLGGGAAAALAERIGAGVHFNTAVPFAGGVVKVCVCGQRRALF